MKGFMERHLHESARPSVPPPVIIRDMTPADQNGKALVHYQAWQETYSGLMDSHILARHTLEHCRTTARRHPENTLTAVDTAAGGRVAGFAAYVPQARDFVSLPGASEISGLYLLREYQGQGLGRRLLASCLERLPHPAAVLFVLEGNEKAIGFYEHFGFRFTGYRRTDRINGGTVTELEMALQRP